jgi:hypothetical protein
MYSCKYCKKEFKKESTLSAHLCEPKRRHQQQNETGVQLGFKAYLRFYELTQGSAKLKTYEDFVASPYYMAFVKFGRYLVAIRCINTGSFIDWLLKNNKKIDYWTKEAFYLEWMREYLKKENVKDALERALKEMQDLADEDSKLNGEFNNYFRQANANRICQHVANGRISPWIVFNCASGVEFLETLNEEQLSMIIEWIDPDYWQRKFKDYMADTEWTKHILKQAGL